MRWSGWTWWPSTHPDTGTLLVKRAVALGGDQVAIEDGVLVVNGMPVCEPDRSTRRDWTGSGSVR